ncbi:chromate resistance protein ChrB domain-containing protein [Ampullimonas aquatilis]|uniref:chromate resistance protein ChrB domain-containing protein n=1 Tax=Ampullimonas aquatilis TaxID=1341549 RepID=UPI003C76C101
MNNWLLLITTLPTENATARMRIWRALKACGVGVLRDGVYLLPQQASCQTTLQTIAADVQASGGTAYLLRIEEPIEHDLIALFDRSEDYAMLLAELAKLHDLLTIDSAPALLKPIRKLRKTFSSLVAIDYFPTTSQSQAETALQTLEQTLARTLTQDEPQAVAITITPRLISQYQGRTWATRQRPWVDRLASAWLIRRFIDPHAIVLWLNTPSDCPADALGFDFDGATFSHTAHHVTFEVLLASFALQQPALKRLGTLVHYLDIGGSPPLPEAAGVESVLAGLRTTQTDDDQLLASACGLFDGLLATFQKEPSPS